MYIQSDPLFQKAELLVCVFLASGSALLGVEQLVMELGASRKSVVSPLQLRCLCQNTVFLESEMYFLFPSEF